MGLAEKKPKEGKSYYQTRGKMHLTRPDGSIYCGCDPEWVNNVTNNPKLVTCVKCQAWEGRPKRKVNRRG